MELEFSAEFRKQYRKANVRIRNQAKDRLRIFKNNPNDLLLNNHELKREWEGYRSIDITSDWRAVYKEVKIGDKIVAYFVDIGTHDELYSK